MALNGRIIARREAVVPLEVLGEDGRREGVDTILDTGFDGDLVLPGTVIAQLDLRPQGARTVILGDGSLVDLPIYRAKVEWDDRERDAQVIGSDGDSLLGMNLLWDHDVYLRAVDGGNVTIERLP